MQASKVFKMICRCVLITGAAMLLAGCASKPTIRTDYDHTIDFSAYKTYGFFTPMGIENPEYTSIHGSVFRDAIGKEMHSRGYQPSASPDLLINVSGRLQNKTRITTASDPYIGGGYYSYRRAYYGAWDGSASTNVKNYTEGTINVDVVDRKQKRMVWEGIAIGRVNHKNSSDDTRENIYSVVQEMFSGYPFRAGQ